MSFGLLGGGNLSNFKENLYITTEGIIGDLSRALSARENCQKYSASILPHNSLAAGYSL